jgi:hypothetical protein
MRKFRARDAVVGSSALAKERMPIAAACLNEIMAIPSFGYLLMSAPIEAGDLPDGGNAGLRDAYF